MTKKFPQIRSAINVKYDPKIISNAKKIGYRISSYDRIDEPIKIKNKENSSISWGIKKTIKNVSRPFDIVFHKGDFGKEPMIIIFGKTPEDVVTKVESVTL